MPSLLFNVTVVFAVATGAAGTALSLLAVYRFWGSPFGRALAVLPPFFLGFTVYHGLLIAVPSFEEAVYVEVSVFLLLVVFAVEMLRIHYQLSRTPGEANA
ncbi:hypothetical protein [Haloparvum sp. AD34]